MAIHKMTQKYIYNDNRSKISDNKPLIAEQ